MLTSSEGSRSRLWLLVCVVAVIVLGLASRKFPLLFPAGLGKYPGDALWAMMVFGGLAFLQPRASAACLAILAFGISCAVELSQLYQAPWLNAIRGTTLGHLALGSTFSWFDIVAYAAGVLLASLVDMLVVHGKRTVSGMRIQLDEQRGSVRVESGGAIVLDLENFPVAELKSQLRTWLHSVDDVSAPVFIFRSDDRNLHGTFRIEPRPERWQFTSWKERVRSPELLSLDEWRQVLRQSGV